MGDRKPKSEDSSSMEETPTGQFMAWLNQMMEREVSGWGDSGVGV
jgi:hypothetical protein